jgi:hypothetical protein
MADTYKRSGEIYKEVMVTPEGYEALLQAIKAFDKLEKIKEFVWNYSDDKCWCEDIQEMLK